MLFHLHIYSRVFRLRCVFQSLPSFRTRFGTRANRQSEIETRVDLKHAAESGYELESEDDLWKGWSASPDCSDELYTSKEPNTDDW